MHAFRRIGLALLGLLASGGGIGDVLPLFVVCLVCVLLFVLRLSCSNHQPDVTDGADQ